jgi:hypothetical protein
MCASSFVRETIEADTLCESDRGVSVPSFEEILKSSDTFLEHVQVRNARSLARNKFELLEDSSPRGYLTAARRDPLGKEIKGDFLIIEVVWGQARPFR